MKNIMIAATISVVAAIPVNAQTPDRALFLRPMTEQQTHAITMAQFITVIIEHVVGNRVFMKAEKAIISRDGVQRIAAGDQVSGEITNLPLRVGDTRLAVCIDMIKAPGATMMVSELPNQYPHDGCLGQLLDAEGAIGLPVKYLKPGERGHIQSNGDLYITVPEKQAPTR